MAIKKPWAPLDLTSLPNCRYIACDPSFSAMGLVFIEVHDGQVYIQEAQTLSTVQTGDGGWESNFDRAEELYGLLRETIWDWIDDWGQSIWSVHEAPPAGGGTLMRPESSILGGREFRRVSLELTLPIDKLVTPQSHKKLICGNHIAKKKPHHDAVRELLPRIHDSRLIKNEALRDALSIGLYAAHRKKEEV
jgi:Holliday junction resolvasome RuvABC endonuclease subunit